MEVDLQQWTPSPGPVGCLAWEQPDEPACLCGPPDAEQLGRTLGGCP